MILIKKNWKRIPFSSCEIFLPSCSNLWKTSLFSTLLYLLCSRSAKSFFVSNSFLKPTPNLFSLHLFTIFSEFWISFPLRLIRIPTSNFSEISEVPCIPKIWEFFGFGLIPRRGGFPKWRRGIVFEFPKWERKIDESFAAISRWQWIVSTFWIILRLWMSDASKDKFFLTKLLWSF